MKSIRRVGLLLALVFFLPAMFFSVYEFSSLSRDEAMIQQIYEKQLDAILFSANQYSDDVVNSWISKIESGLNEQEDEKDTLRKIQNLLTLNTSLKYIFIYDSSGWEPERKVFSIAGEPDSISRLMDKAVGGSKAQIERLIAYKSVGFQKIEPLNYLKDSTSGLQALILISGDEQHGVKLICLLIDPGIFVHEVVGPRLQVIAKDQFVLSMFAKNVDVPMYSTNWLDTAGLNTESLTKSFWLFPDYTLGIRSQGYALRDLIDKRTNTNFALLVVFDIVLIIAVILVFLNVKREVQLVQNKADFVSNVSHEIRTPLALISMFAETLEMGRVKSEEKKLEYYRIISKETQRLSGIVNKILNFSQTEANKKTLHITPIDVNFEIKDILSTYDFHLRNKGFEYTFTDTSSPIVKADKEAFVESVINLIDNAMKYSEERKSIEIRTGVKDKFGYVSVCDKGVGISLSDQKHIFDKFYRVSSGNLAKSRGTGLGLSLVKQLMEAQKGNVTVSSQPGKGSDFTLFFPLNEQSTSDHG